MDLSKMGETEARSIVMRAMELFAASIDDQQRTSPTEIQDFPLDLSVARTRSDALKVSIPFKSLLVEQASDLSTYIFLVPVDKDSGNGAIRLGLKDVYKSEFGFRECYIYWDAQPTKKMILKFFTRSVIENGRLVLDQQSDSRTMNMAGQSVQDNTFNCVLERSIIHGPINAGQVGVARLACRNNPQYNTGAGFVVPSGFEFVITSFEKINRLAVPSAEVGLTFITFKQTSPSFVAGVYAYNNAGFEKNIYTVDGFTKPYYKSPLTAVDDTAVVFPYSTLDISTYALGIISAGKAVFAGLENNGGSPNITNIDLDIRVIGYLRAV